MFYLSVSLILLSELCGQLKWKPWLVVSSVRLHVSHADLLVCFHFQWNSPVQMCRRSVRLDEVRLQSNPDKTEVIRPIVWSSAGDHARHSQLTRAVDDPPSEKKNIRPWSGRQCWHRSACVSCSMNSVAMLRCTPSTMSDPPFTAASQGLITGTPYTVGAECGSMAGLQPRS